MEAMPLGQVLGFKWQSSNVALSGSDLDDNDLSLIPRSYSHGCGSLFQETKCVCVKQTSEKAQFWANEGNSQTAGC